MLYGLKRGQMLAEYPRDDVGRITKPIQSVGGIGNDVLTQKQIAEKTNVSANQSTDGFGNEFMSQGNSESGVSLAFLLQKPCLPNAYSTYYVRSKLVFHDKTVCTIGISA